LNEAGKIDVASIADMQFRFEKCSDRFNLKLIGADEKGNDFEITMSSDMAVAISKGVLIAIEQNAERSARIAAGARVIDEPEIRSIQQIHTH